MRWGDLRLRILSAAVLAPVALACLWIGGWPWTVLIAAAATGLSLEWVRLCGEGMPSAASVALLAAVLSAVLVAAGGDGAAALGLIVAGIAVVWLLRRSARLAAGVAYVGVAAVALVWLRTDLLGTVAPAGRANVLFVVLNVWSSDIGAYVAGRLLGGPRMAPAISPGKTWSGAAGGLAAAMAVGWLTAVAYAMAPASGALAAAAGLGVVSQAGDLLESALKRRFGVKDSGHLIPGHGGLLDRLDGLLAAAPAAALLALCLGRGVVLWR